MRETMFRILTYEPFERITGDEKKYIKAVLKDDLISQQNYPLYDELMQAFNACKGTDVSSLVKWYNKYYTTKDNGEIKVLWSKDKNERTYYPVLFKKICYYCLTEYDFLDAQFMGQFGISVGIINKWRISPRYGRMINKDTYSAIRLKRNGRKIEYLTKVIKAIYYEACRQVAESEKDWMSAKKANLMAFVDVFAGTGTVTASVDARWSIANDKELGAACFLYCMNRFNQNPKQYSCDTCKTVDALTGSYISYVEEEAFLFNPQRYIDNAYEKSENDAEGYDLCKKRK